MIILCDTAQRYLEERCRWTKTFETRVEAMDYLLDAIGCCDPGSSECGRYVSALQKLRAGQTVIPLEELY